MRECERTVVEVKVLHEKTNALNRLPSLLFERQFCVERMRLLSNADRRFGAGADKPCGATLPVDMVVVPVVTIR
jgi:hypothetical protein